MPTTTRRVASVLAGALALLFLLGSGFIASPAAAEHCQDIFTHVPDDCDHDPCEEPEIRITQVSSPDPCDTPRTTLPPITVPRDPDTPRDEIPTTTVTAPEPAEVESIEVEEAPAAAVLPRTGAGVAPLLLTALGLLGGGVGLIRATRRPAEASRS